MRRRRNDAVWRGLVLELRGEWCRACGTTAGVQVDHLIPRAHGGPSVVENGLPLCLSCHEAKTGHRLLITLGMLDGDTVGWLAAAGYAWWDELGEVCGPRRRIFAATGDGPSDD